MRRLTARISKALVLLVVLAMAAAACSADDAGEAFEEVSQGLRAGDGGPTATVEASTDAPDVDTEEAKEASTDEGSLGTGGISPIALQTTTFGRDIIFTADMTVAVPDVATAGEEATRIVQGLGGFLFGQQTTAAPEARSILTFKIAPENFQEALAALGSIGEVRTQNVSANDVTEEIVDLESQISTAATSVDRLRALLAEATEIKQIVELENELLARETQLERLRGQLRTLQDQVALATIVVALTEAEANPGIDTAVTMYTGHDGGIGCPGELNGFQVEEGSPVTVCYEVFNVGDTNLADIELRDPVLDLTTEDLLVVFGDLDETIEPGQSIVLAAEVTAERDIRTQTTVTATPVDEDGNEIEGRTATQTTTAFLDTVDPGGIPSFGEGLERSWEWLVGLGQVLLLLAGVVLPFLWVPALIVAGWFVRRRMQDRRPPTGREATES